MKNLTKKEKEITLQILTQRLENIIYRSRLFNNKEELQIIKSIIKKITN
jgi:hypothetical protein